jgi:hypothetical protein
MDFFNNITASILFLYVTVFTMLAYPGYLTSRVPSYMLTTSKMALWMHFSSAAGVIYTIIFLILFTIDFTFLSACVLGILGYALSGFSLMVLGYVLNVNPIRWLLGFVFSLIWPIFAFLLTIELPMFK